MYQVVAGLISVGTDMGRVYIVTDVIPDITIMRTLISGTQRETEIRKLFMIQTLIISMLSHFATDHRENV